MKTRRTLTTTHLTKKLLQILVNEVCLVHGIIQIDCIVCSLHAPPRTDDERQRLLRSQNRAGLSLGQWIPPGLEQTPFSGIQRSCHAVFVYILAATSNLDSRESTINTACTQRLHLVSDICSSPNDGRTIDLRWNSIFILSRLVSAIFPTREQPCSITTHVESGVGNYCANWAQRFRDNHNSIYDLALTRMH